MSEGSDLNRNKANVNRNTEQNGTENNVQNSSEINSDSVNKNSGKDKSGNLNTAVPFNEALALSGNGLYNILLTLSCAFVLLAGGMDLFGFSLVVTAACDLNLSISQKGILTSLPFMAILFASYGWGFIADTKGRRFTILLSLRVGFVLACLSAFSPHWIVLAILKFLSVFFSCATNSVTYTLVGESCVHRVRNKYMLLMTSLLLLSPAVAALFAYPTLNADFQQKIPWLGIVFSPWRLLIIVLALPMGILSIVMHFCHESPKFLAYRGKQKEAIDVLKYMYSVNHRKTTGEYNVHSLMLEEGTKIQSHSILKLLSKQTKPLFQRPLLWRTLQLYYIVGVIYITNNSLLVWLPHIFTLVKTALGSTYRPHGNICSLITVTHIAEKATTAVPDVFYTPENGTVVFHPNFCVSTISENVIMALVISQSIFSFLNFCLSYLYKRRKVVLILILCFSAISGFCVNLIPEPIPSVVFFILFTSTCLGMGILASYFVDIYPTSCTGMAACLSIMVGRSSAFAGINIVALILFDHCELTFYLWAVLVLSSLVLAIFLPADKSVNDA